MIKKSLKKTPKKIKVTTEKTSELELNKVKKETYQFSKNDNSIQIVEEKKYSVQFIFGNGKGFLEQEYQIVDFSIANYIYSPLQEKPYFFGFGFYL